MIKNSAIAALASISLIGLVGLVGACTVQAKNHEGFQGVIELDERQLGFELGGRLAEVPVERGHLVAQGQLLARLDDTLGRPVRDARAADLRAARAQLGLLQAGARPEDIRVAEAQLRATRERVAQLDRNLKQQRLLADRGAAGFAVVQDLENDLARAREDEAAQAQRVRLLRSGARPEEIEAAEAKVAGAAAALAAEDKRLERHVLAADRPGRVLDVHLEAGEIVGAGTPVVTVADTQHPFVDVFVPELETARVAIGMRAQVVVDGLPGALPGTVEDIGRTTEFTPKFVFSPRERPNLVIRVRVRIDDPKESLRAGMPAFVTFGDGGGKP
jgi:HlyD family secretion protein